MKYIQLTQGKKAIIDDEDFEKVNKLKWNLWNTNGNHKYVGHWYKENGKQKVLLLHRFLLQPPNNKDIDHINRNGLDNRKCNLRIVTSNENLHNSKINKNNKLKLRGIYYVANNKKFRVQLCNNGKHIQVGYFRELKDAIIAYNEAHKNLFQKEFWNLNTI